MNELHCLYFNGGKCTMKARCMWQKPEGDECKNDGLLPSDCLSPPADRTYLLQNEFSDRARRP